MGGLFGGGGTQSSQPAAANAISVQTSQYAKPVPLVYGTNRVTGNIIWYGNFQAIANTSNDSSGGKGGGSGNGSVTYTYTAALAIALSQGPVTGINQVWTSSDLTDLPTLGLSFFAGAPVQTPWGYLSTNFPGQDLSYRGTAYVAAPNFFLGGDPSLPNLSFEVMGLLTTGFQDINPAAILFDYLTNSEYGAGISASHIGDWTGFDQYCTAMSYFISPVYDSQTQAQENIQDILDATNSAIFWSDGVLKIVPYADSAVTGNGIEFIPDVTPIYDLDDDHFIFKSGEDPVQITRSSPADAYNLVDVEWSDRNNAYNVSIAEAKDQLAISLYGPRPDTTRSYDFITTQAMAQSVAQTLVQRDVYIRNTYQFTLGWTFCALEPMDLVTLTDVNLGLNKQPVRITQIQEDDSGNLTFTAEEFPLGVATPALYSAQGGAAAVQNRNVAAPNVTNAVIFEPHGQLTNDTLEVWAAVCGGLNWGGCDVWVSSDNATYKLVGSINGGARMGVLAAALPSGGDPDTANTLAVNMAESGGTLLSGTQAAADTYQTLCWVDGELISYETATLAAANLFDLTYLRRGVYGSSIGAHAKNAPFVRLDQAVFEYPFDVSLIGTPLYVKFVSFNQYGAGKQSLDIVPTFTYNVLGTALLAPLGNVTGLTTNYIAGIMQLIWNAVDDTRSIDYEIRLGSSWASAQTLGRTPLTNIPTQGDGTYWVAAHYTAPQGVDLFSPVPVEILLTGTVLVQNVVASFDEIATGLLGTFSGGAADSGGMIVLQGTGNVLAVSSFLSLTDVLHYGGLAMSGGYALPSAHTIDAGRVTTASVRMSCLAVGQSIFDNILTQPDVLTMTDVLDSVSGQFINVTTQIAIAQADGVFGAWQNYQPGTYSGQYFKAQVLLSTSNSQVQPEVTALTFAVDVPDRIDTFTNVALSVSGSTFTYATPFNGGPSGSVVPHVQVTILAAQQGDTVVVSASSVSSVTIRVLNGGIGVARNANIYSQGY